VRWLALVMAAALAGCGAGADAGGRPQLTVSAASSLKTAFTEYGERFRPADARFSFAGSDELAAQIRQGVEPDVYAAANTKLPQELYQDGLVERPVTFARNRLVLAVPDGSTITSLGDVERRGTRLAIGSASVPVGSYTRAVLDRLPPADGRAILANVRSEEPDVAGIVGKLTQGAVDAGFVYASDVRAAGGGLTAIELPDELQPAVEYGVAVVEGAKHPEQARAFVDGLLHGAGARALRDAGFERP
jgi:molybdate transport system substrate-binding protein